MKVLKKVERLMEYITRYSAYIAALALLFNVVIVVAYIASRATNHAIIGTEECVAMGQVVLISMAFGYTHFNRGLVHVGFFMKKLPGPCPMAAWVLDNWISAVICVLWTYESIIRFPVVRQISQILVIPYKPFFLVMTVGIGIYTLSQIFEAVKCTVGIFNKNLRQEIQENWPA